MTPCWAPRLRLGFLTHLYSNINYYLTLTERAEDNREGSNDLSFVSRGEKGFVLGRKREHKGDL